MARLLGVLTLAVLIATGVWLWRSTGSADASSAPASLSAELHAVGQEMRSAKLKASVRTAIGLNRSLKPWPIEVEVPEPGVVTLRGDVATEALRETAGRVASAVPDVTRVVNEVHASAGLEEPVEKRSLRESVDDRALEMRVRLAWSLNRGLKGTDMDVRVFRSDMLVSGEIERPEQRALAVETAEQVPGAGRVADELRMRGNIAAPVPSPTPLAGERARLAQQALLSNPNLAGFELVVSEEGGRLVVSGTVKTGAEKDLAGLVAKEAAGGSVDNQVKVAL
jgi:osmotically-inducible protein OsmY